MRDIYVDVLHIGWWVVLLLR